MKPDNRRFLKSASGFSLIQISIILTVAGLLMVAVLPSPQTRLQSDAGNVTKMNAILLALREYQATNGYLPCPSSPTLPTGNSNYGVASSPGTNCPSAAKVSSNNIAIGMVPVKTMGLSYDYALDSYGRDITYAVDINANGGAATGMGCWATTSISSPAITVTDHGASKSVVAVLVSHGADGYGAWLPLQGSSGTASRLDNGSKDTNQADNAQVAHGGGLTWNSSFASFEIQDAGTTFDDVVVYQNPQWNLAALPVKQTACVGGGGAPYYRAITIDHTKVPNTDQTSFPVLFSGTYSPYLKTVANGGKVQNASGYDITFTSDAAGTHLLPFERENYNATTGEIEAWVQIPTVSHTTDTVIYLQYDNVAITTDKSNTTGTWDANYKAVYHFNGALTDSTSNAVALTAPTSPPTATTGQIAGAQAFTSTTCLYSAASIIGGATTYTMSAWASPSSTAGVQTVLTVGYDTSNSWPSGMIGWQENSMIVNTTWQGFDDSDSVSGGYFGSTVNVSANTWAYITLVDTAGSYQLYVNGVPSGSPFSFSASGSLLDIGCRYQQHHTASNHSGYAFLNPFTGLIDEVRGSIVARSADWIKTEYNNQSSPGTFYTVGAETPVSR